MRRRTGVAAAVAVLLSAAALAATAAASSPPTRTVNVDIHFSRFDLASLQVAPGETVRFVVTNEDPIDHELIVGGAYTQRIHENGTEPAHGARPGEISVAPGATVETRSRTSSTRGGSSHATCRATTTTGCTDRSRSAEPRSA